MNITNRFPATFIGHGSPMNIIQKNDYTAFLHNYAQRIEKPECIVVISAHWLTRGTLITGSNHPKQLFDFYGFPAELYNIKYTPVGSNKTAQDICYYSQDISIDENRGLDHAAWAILKHMYPQADIPVLEMSIDMTKTPEEHYLFAKQLSRFRENGILFIGSGNLIHNLQVFDFQIDSLPMKWALDIDSVLKEKLEQKNIHDLIHYQHGIKNYQMAIPTNEHYLPLLYILGMMSAEERISTIHESIQNGTISMRSIEIQ